MTYTRKSVPGEKIAEARQLYEQTLVPVREVAALLGFSRTTLQRRVAEWGWKKRQQDALEVMQPHKGAGVQPQSPPQRVALAARIQAVAEREIAAIENILDTLGPSASSETEGAARTLASLARTLRELVQLDVPTTSPEPTHDEPAPRDLAELRRSLARKLAALSAGDAAPLPGNP